MSAIHFQPLPPISNLPGDDAEGLTRQYEFRAVLAILADYVQPSSTLSLDKAVDQVTQFWNESRSRYSIAVLVAPISLAEEIPYDHPSHKKLADFMLALHDSGKWMTECKPDQFCGYLRDEDWAPETEVGSGEDPMHYANRCAFVANLSAPESELERFPYLEARAAMSHAGSLDHTLAGSVRDARVIGAAQYIFFQAPTIFDEVLKTSRREAEFAKAKGCFSRLIHRKRAPPRSPEEEFYSEDWHAWKDMFRAAAVDETHGKACRETAQRAADLMALQEKVEDDRSAAS